MTLTKRYLAELSDIRALRFECHGCQATYSVAPEKAKNTTYVKCANCNAILLVKENLDDVKELFHALDGLKKRASEIPCNIQLEFALPESASQPVSQ